ncbi:MAG: hypothetical protein QOF62_3880 [Pyrinomonadaceae bacterium]|jgi:hypothetical protein|nr:hypothetical protein [Pyrinomonadaceae bacterium]
MVWASVLLLVAALYPTIFDRIKKLKIKDFEIELQEIVAESKTEDFLSVADLHDDYLFSQKGSWRNLIEILGDARRSPERQILLAVNLKDGAYISIPMLFAYLHFLDLVGGPVLILVVDTRRRLRHLADIRRKDVVGALAGQPTLKALRRLFPQLSTISTALVQQEENFARGEVDLLSEHSLASWYDSMSPRFRNQRSEFLTQSDVERWFASSLNKESIDVHLSSGDLRHIKDALTNSDQFILAFDGDALNSIVSVCRLASKISRRALESFGGRKTTAETALTDR